jgi:hypothetical protein
MYLGGCITANLNFSRLPDSFFFFKGVSEERYRSGVEGKITNFAIIKYASEKHLHF